MRRTPALVLLVLAVGACARQAAGHDVRGAATSPATAEPTTEQAWPISIDWELPLKGGIVVESVSAAQKYVAFTIMEAKFGTPDVIEVDDPSIYQLDDGSMGPGETVAFVYHLPGYGTVVLEEKPPGAWTIDQMQARADAPNALPDTFQMVALRGTSGLLIQAREIGRIMWIEDGILFDMTGPSISPAQVVELASMA